MIAIDCQLISIEGFKSLISTLDYIIIIISLKIANICPYRIGYWYWLYFFPAYRLSVYRLKVILVQH